ncbi:ACT domain-containing protein [Macrococcoides caseolyticum]|uniref:ACT domain-containing protein n=1 Tax=Macrococcoides caseolyticum TaxID=69966 RepID=UPI000C15D3D7|nr:ACT domain-containing protein [Macrococcus caseolyticus]MBQ5151957.1 ACT domain-containing protein [Macrococcus caseolyticus]MDJ1088183.1 ACT domain-containing protein [Macrococcus caseolyticus]MDJ1090848.1 ACT domain-containing protein [Macrococcus caseolyticus]MDJ1108721.1 ACT domain-containing protein [Macrococcus caseolyticus]MDJ1152546.1 ACT domain-containing protein [Macrococcus caseolyticus]
MTTQKKFYLIREDVLPESVKKTLLIKDLLDKNPKLSIFDAVKKHDLSRSAYYKYKDTIFPVDEKTREKNLTIMVQVDDKVGLLSEILSFIALHNGSVLTIHQTIPIKEKTTITISLNATDIDMTINELIEAISSIEHVNDVKLLGMSL